MIRGLINLIGWERLWSEFWNVFKFGIVGISSLGVNAAIYALLSRVLWVSGDRTLEAVIAIALASIYNFSLHRAWTFQTRAFSSRMLARYIIVVFLGSGLHGGLFYVGHELLGWYDFAVLIGTAFLVAAFTYFAHRFFTFNTRFEAVVVDAVDAERGTVVHAEVVKIEKGRSY
ncbi:hypothetical protein GF380_02045 [Candidatus Uhrbacteria bacterium]|nr:hypothetical protein [Candidatus Uhrbacteria bacterium]MBD3284010.1 hypothetical protein [Candidatus Uhrbacteria bacterium]